MLRPRLASVPLALAAVLVVSGSARHAAAQTTQPLTCTSVPAGAPAFVVELVTPDTTQTALGCHVLVRGSVHLEGQRPHDVYLVVDSSGSTRGASGVDVDNDGVLGTGDWRANTDLGDSTLSAELEAINRALTAWDGHDVRVSVEEYSAVIPIPPGEISEQGRIRTVQGLTASFPMVRASLPRILRAGSVGGTDYGGALLELAAEFDRSGDPSRNPVAFFLSDGKPTFPRYPYDRTEPPDVDWAMSGAAAVALRGLPTSTLEIGTFDDVGVLRDVAATTGGSLLPGLAGGELLDALATMNLDGFTSVRGLNVTTGEEHWATLSPFGEFEVMLDLADGPNELTFTAVLRTPAGEWTIACPVSIEASCRLGDIEEPPPVDRYGRARLGEVDRRWYGGVDMGGYTGSGRWTNGGGGGGGGGGYDAPDGRWVRRHMFRYRWRETRDRLREWGIEPCETLGGNAGLSTECDRAAQQLAALLISVESGELQRDCLLDPAVVPAYADVGELIDELEAALTAMGTGRCRRAADRAELVTSGPGLLPDIQGPPPGPATFACTLRQDGADVDVAVQLQAPPPGTVSGGGRPCPAQLEVSGASSARGNRDHDVYFVVDTSGSTAGDSGRDIDADGLNDNTLEAELQAVREFVSRLDPARVRVALIEFSAVIPIPPGEPSEQGRIRTVQSLTSDFSRIETGLQQILAAGPAGATDYGGALLELAAEYDRNGDPSRGAVAFFMSDGKPTFPRYPYDSSETPDVDYAMQGAAACALRNINVNTYEVGVFDDLSVLLDVALVTGGRYYPSLAGGAIVDALPGSSLVGIESVTVTNLLTGQSVTATVQPDGSWSADINLAPGENAIMITVTSDGGAEIVECRTTYTGDCVPLVCATRTPQEWAEEDCP